LDLKALGAAWRGVAVIPLRRQLAVLVAAVAALFVAALWFAWAEYRNAHFGESHLAAAAEMRTLSQRLAKAALRSLRGDPEAFPQVQASRDGFASALARLAKETLPRYEADNGPLSTKQLNAIKRLEPQGRMLVKDKLFA